MTAKERERALMIGAPLAIVPALVFLPTVIFLIIFPRVAHGRAIGILSMPICLLTGGCGLWKLATGVVQKPWGLFNFLNVGMLLVLVVIAAYTGLFLALLTVKL